MDYFLLVGIPVQADLPLGSARTPERPNVLLAKKAKAFAKRAKKKCGTGKFKLQTLAPYMEKSFEKIIEITHFMVLRK